MKFFASALGLASVASAHTLFTNIYIDGKNQGDGTCVREPSDASKANSPIYPITGADMACNHNGANAVNFTCPATSGAQITFEFRESPAYTSEGVIAEGHKGPCSVYIKKVDDIFESSASGPGWFKIWEDGYDVEKETWCVDTLRANNGHLSVDLPTGLPSGYYLVRPEVLALHNALNGDPQFYAGCAQIYIENGPEIDLDIPDEFNVSIPGYVKADDDALTFNIYETPLGEYPMPGPEVYIPTSSDIGEKHTQEDGVCPETCLARNANWCGKPLDDYSDQTGCWAAAKDCWNQADTCWDSAPPSGSRGCSTWNDYCSAINDQCSAHNYDGLPEFDLSEVNADVPGPIPEPYGSFNTTSVDGTSDSDDSSTSTKATSTKATATTKDSSSEQTSSAYEQPASTTNDSSSEETSTAYEEPSSTDESSSKATETAYIPPAETETETETEEATSTYSSIPEETSSSSSGLKISEDGRCGGETGQTCEGSAFGNCCSKKGHCGRKTRHCYCGCQSAFGQCE